MRDPGVERCTLLPGRLSFAVHDDDDHTIREIRANPSLYFTSTDLQERYAPFHSDFGPVNLGVVVRFCRYLTKLFENTQLQKREIVYYCWNDPPTIANTTFLLVSYLVLEHGLTPEDATAPFQRGPHTVIPFQDTTGMQPTFPLTVLDCVKSLKKAMDRGWFGMENFDLDEYWRMEDPQNGDIHRICPTLTAFPCDTKPGSDNMSSAAWFATQARTLRDLGVSRVVRLESGRSQHHSHSEMEAVFEAAGIRRRDLAFEDLVPSFATVSDFLEECKDAERLGVCCSTGLGKTGTLIGVWIMLHGGFSAREAIAWMRIVRPGMVMGCQQQYLQDVEREIRDGRFPSVR